MSYFRYGAMRGIRSSPIDKLSRVSKRLLAGLLITNAAERSFAETIQKLEIKLVVVECYILGAQILVTL